MSKYAPISDYFRSIRLDEVSLTFDEFAEIVQSPLPPSAFKHAEWWINSRTGDSHSWARRWVSEGWERVGLDLEARTVSFRRIAPRIEYFDYESQSALEGYEFDRTILSKGRNAALADRRRQLDAYTCQVCAFRLELDGKFIIDVHHLKPIGSGGERETTIEDLVSLCPTCHRIAHLRSSPYTLEELRAIRANQPFE